MTKSPRCPICRAPQSQEFRPFCSRRCADVDLGRWMTGAYSAPAEEEDEFSEIDLDPEPKPQWKH